MDLVKSLTAEVEFSTLKGGRIIYAHSGIEVCKFTPFEETCFVTSPKKKCHITFEIMRNLFFLWRKLYRSL